MLGEASPLSMCFYMYPIMNRDHPTLSFSAGKPKVENALKTICLMLGPDYITDILEVIMGYNSLLITITSIKYLVLMSDGYSSASASPEIQEFSGIWGIFKERKSTFREEKKYLGISSIIYN